MRRRVTDPAAFGRVAVLMGGWSSEREVSLWSGQGVTDALKSLGVDAKAVDADRATVLRLGELGFDRAFNVLHGTGGEDGTVQAVLDLQNIPYTGSGVLASALAMDKLRTKRMWKAEGLPTPDWMVLHTADDARAAGSRLGYPYFVKPAEEGSSVGVNKVKHADTAVAAFENAARSASGMRRTVIAERFVDGSEYTCSMLDGVALPVIRIEPDGEFYDYNAKYLSDATRYHCPAGLDPRLEAQIQQTCLQAFELVGAEGWGRVDFMLDSAQQPWLIEVNTVPGMTSHSLVPMAARAVGMDYAALCWAILETTLCDQGEAA
ncbi:D-alanine--D-alanine ligase [Sinimarinibacterium sp. CAU 1509]|uniref:D-alanine--D-alanine ligase n=1 Tax=Sinimarinibacterium sp. CAU 1509 TaxID=2562283 RepID=UPI0010AC45CE|nr:D-alanine--D-alanine ligase [Sinimarinibacterium sp. CAU 1509]TJY65163.1 D-alanine--D-alanine ligase [Sinimarinibacterium sp. CAU 1509]